MVKVTDSAGRKPRRSRKASWAMGEHTRREHNGISFVARTSPSHSSRYRIRFQRDRICGVSTTKFEYNGTASAVMVNQPVRLPALPWITYRGQTFSKFLLLAALGFFLLLRVARLLLRARSRDRHSLATR